MTPTQRDELLRRLRDPRNQFLFDPEASKEAWKLLNDAAQAIELLTRSAHDVCEGMYSDRVDDVLELCDALNAVRALAGEDPEILKIVDDAIREHGIRE